MQYESAQQVADRMGVTVRAVQKWASNGKFPGAKRVGKVWLIPQDPQGANEAPVPNTPMPLLTLSFVPGTLDEVIARIPEQNNRKLTEGNAAYFRGDYQAAKELCEPFLESADVQKRFTAGIVCSFSQLSLGSSNLVQYTERLIQQDGERNENGTLSPLNASLQACALQAARVILRLPIEGITPPAGYPRNLPEGLRLFSRYLDARKAYAEKEYGRALGIADTALVLSSRDYPVVQIYLNLIAAVALINLKQTEDARQRFLAALETARPDRLYGPFAEHYGVLQGLPESCLKKDFPQEYETIATLARPFSRNWQKYLIRTRRLVSADALTPAEFSVVMLYCRGWGAKEIAGHLNLSERSVRTRIQTVYEKLGVSSKKELEALLPE